jgi:hypothetical protein
MEGLGRESTESGAQLPGMPIDAPAVQIALARHMYRSAHPKAQMDTDSALTAWTQDPGTLAARYRQYVQQHPHERVNIGDEDALSQLLNTLTSGTDITH